MSKSRTYPIYKTIYKLVKAIYPRISSENTALVPDEPTVFVGNHTQMNGPIVAEIYFPTPRKTWCAAPMMSMREVPEYAFNDFWSQKPKYLHPVYRLLSYIIAPIAPVIFRNARTIPVYRDHRIMTTFRETIDTLSKGESVVIFPEEDKKHNHIVNSYQQGFVDVARLYHKKTGRPLKFVPFYIAPRLKTLTFGNFIEYDPDDDPVAQRASICEYLMNETTRIAEALPEHIVVPYRNMPKKYYPKSRTEVPKN